MSAMRFGLVVPPGSHEKARKALRDLEYKLTKKLLSTAVRAAGKETLSDAKAAVPVRTGLLKKSMKLRVAKAKKPYVRFKVTNAPEAYYGLWVEVGSSRQKAQHELHRLESRTQAELSKYVGAALSAAMR